MIHIYGIPNCDTIKKAKNWLTEHQIDFNFHNFKKEGLSPEKLDQWIAQVGWQVLLNKRGMMWRKLSDEAKQNIHQERAIQIMLETPSIIKRPVLEFNDSLHIGFKPAQYIELFQT